MSQIWLKFFIIVLFQQYNIYATESKNCTMAGRFPNNLESDCRGYTMCLKVLNDFTRIDLVCPEHSIYSHIDSQCTNVTFYQCFPEYNCTREGEFKNPSITDCASYISCFEGMGSMVTARLSDCPPGLLFDPAVSTCVNDTLFKCVVPTPETPRVFEVSIKYTTESPVGVNSKGNVFYIKTHYVIYLLILILYYLNKI